jgi:glycosyltransferase involved in cell wall biosynthesis
MRAALGLAERRVLIYVGKFTGWYMEREMVDFFAVAREREPNLYFQVLTQSDPQPIASHFQRAGVPNNSFSITRVTPDMVGRHLSAADVAISFIRPCPSKVSSSPTKIGEYLAAGLPIVSSAGVGDIDRLIGEADTGVLVSTFDRDSYARAACRLLELASDTATAARCIAVARQSLSTEEVAIPAYDRLYRAVARDAMGPRGWLDGRASSLRAM